MRIGFLSLGGAAGSLLANALVAICVKEEMEKSGSVHDAMSTNTKNRITINISATFY